MIEVDVSTDLVPIFPAGMITGDDGRGPYYMQDAAAVIQASRRQNVDLVIDRDHAADLAPRGTQVKAAGWIKEMVEQDGAIFARVEWTATARQELDAKEYRYISPSFLFNPETRVITRILRATLTNTPNFDMVAVASAGAGDQENNHLTPKETTMTTKVLLALAAVMGLAATSTEDQIETAAKNTIEENKTLKAELASIRTSLKLADTADAKAVTETAASLFKAANEPDPAKFVPMDVHKETASQLKALQQSSGQDKATAAVETAMKAGKIAPTQKAWALGYASKDLKAFEDFVSTAPVIVTAAAIVQGSPTQAVQDLSAADREVCSQLGLTEEQFKKTAAEVQAA